MDALAPLLVAIVLLIITAAIAASYLSAVTPLLRRSGASRAIQLAGRGVAGALSFFASLLVRRRPRRVRPLPATRTDRRKRGSWHHDRLF